MVKGDRCRVLFSIVGVVVTAVGATGCVGPGKRLGSITATSDAGTPFDLEFGASLFMDQVDSAPDDNFQPITVEVISGGDEGLDQAVAASPGLFPSDADCNACSSGM